LIFIVVVVTLQSVVDSVPGHDLSIIYDKFMDEWLVM